MLLPTDTDHYDMAVYPGSPPLRGNSLRTLRGLGDEQLTELVATGSEPAFAVIYDRYMPALMRYCRRILGSSEDAEDAAQAAMVRALSALGKRPPRRLRPWLYRIAHNEAIGLTRKNVNGVAQLDPEQADHGADPAHAASTRARLGQLLADIHALPGRQRDALVMRELCGRPYGEIAAELGTSQGAAQQAVFEARSSLHEFGKGRDLACVEIQRSISDCEHGHLRSRRVRAHLRSCERCASFERELYARRRDFALLLPWVGPATMPEILGLANGSHALARLVRAPLPPDGLRAAAAVTAAAALGVTGLTLNALNGPPHGGVGAAARAAAVRFSSNPGAARPLARGTAATPVAVVKRHHGKSDASTPTLSAAQGGQSQVPGRSAADLSGAASAAAPGAGQRSDPGRSSGGGHLPTLAAQTPGVEQTLGAVKSVGTQVVSGVSQTVNGAGSAAGNAVNSAGSTVTQTTSGATGTVNSATQGVGSTVDHLLR